VLSAPNLPSPALVLLAVLAAILHHRTNLRRLAHRQAVIWQPLVVPMASRVLLVFQPPMHRRLNMSRPRRPLFNIMKPMLKVSSKIPIHKSSVVQHLVDK
jgi:hypothetical protein